MAEKFRISRPRTSVVLCGLMQSTYNPAYPIPCSQFVDQPDCNFPGMKNELNPLHRGVFSHVKPAGRRLFRIFAQRHISEDIVIDKPLGIQFLNRARRILEELRFIVPGIFTKSQWLVPVLPMWNYRNCLTRNRGTSILSSLRMSRQALQWSIRSKEYLLNRSSGNCKINREHHPSSRDRLQTLTDYILVYFPGSIPGSVRSFNDITLSTAIHIRPNFS
jgi:hypothetical protein